METVFLLFGSVMVLMIVKTIVMKINVMVCLLLIFVCVCSTIIVYVDISEIDYLPFLRLRAVTNAKKDLPPSDDTTSSEINIPFGMAFGNAFQTTAYVS